MPGGGVSFYFGALKLKSQDSQSPNFTYRITVYVPYLYVVDGRTQHTDNRSIHNIEKFEIFLIKEK